MTLISAVTVFHDDRSAKEAVACVEALLGQSIAKELEIIVVDNGARRSASQIFETGALKDDRVTFLHAPSNLGFGRANNLGASRSKGTYLLVINPDTHLESGALERMARFLKEQPDAGIVGPKLLFRDGTARDSYRTFPRPFDLIVKRTLLRPLFRQRMRSYLQWDADPSLTRDVDWLCGACFLMERSLFRRLGGFDERFFLFFEDCDLCRRSWMEGKRVVFLPEAIARDHEQRLSAGGLVTLFTKWTVREHLRSAVKYFWKWRGKQNVRCEIPSPMGRG